MPFEKGESGNPAGRPKGSFNKTTKELRQMISDFLMENFEEVQQTFKELPPKEKVKLYCDLLSFALPRLRPVDETVLERLSDQELDELFEKLKDAANKSLQNQEAET